MSNTAEEEHELLSSVNASIQAQDIYEDQVIREATQQLAPLLTGVGLPPLFSLAPSYDSRFPERYSPSDETHIFSVLNAMRRKLQTNNDSNEQLTHAQQDLLHFKEQLMLSFLATVANKSPEELPVRLELERVAEQKRAERLQNAPNSTNRHVKDNDKVVAAPGERSQNRVSIMQRKAALVLPPKQQD